MRNEAELEYEQMCAELDHLRECDKASRKLIAELEAKMDRVQGCQQYVLKGSGTPAEVMSGGTYMKTADVKSALGDEE